MILIAFSWPQIKKIIFSSCLDVSVIIANILMFLIGTAHIKKFYKCTPIATKHALHANFIYVHEKVILLGRSRAIYPEHNQSSILTLSVPKWQVPTQKQNDPTDDASATRSARGNRGTSYPWP